MQNSWCKWIMKDNEQPLALESNSQAPYRTSRVRIGRIIGHKRSLTSFWERYESSKEMFIFTNQHVISETTEHHNKFVGFFDLSDVSSDSFPRVFEHAEVLVSRFWRVIVGVDDRDLVYPERWQFWRSRKSYSDLFLPISESAEFRMDLWLKIRKSDEKAQLKPWAWKYNHKRKFQNSHT